jgi:dihydrofolate reductase
MEIILIAAMSLNRVIGRKNSIPWHFPEEIQHFKVNTTGHAVIMGRNTFESIGKALPNRENIVLSRKTTLTLPGCHVAHSLEEGITYCSYMEKVFIIGGRVVYRQAMEYVDTILLSILPTEYSGDIYFPDIPEDSFLLVSEKEIGTEQPFTLQKYQRIVNSQRPLPQIPD